MQARTKARTNALADGSNMPNLPLEVIQIIFTVSLPSRPNFNDRSRLDFLLPLCLVHPSLTRSIQRILFANIYLRGMEPICRFLESLELVPESKRWVKTLKLVLNGEYGRGRDAATVNNALSVIVEHCVEMEEVELYDVESVNLALFAQLKHLRSLTCSDLHLMYFEPIVGKPGTFESLDSLSFFSGSPIELSDPYFFTPEVLPSLRRLSIELGDDEGPIDSNTDLYGIASQLRHLSFELSEGSLDPLVDKCTNLLSLAVSINDIVSSPRRLGKPLVGLRLHSVMEDEESDTAIELLEGALSNGLISTSTDSRTVIFLSGVGGEIARKVGLSKWAESVGLELNYNDGALEREWRSVSSNGGHSEFTEWVDREAARREAVAERRKSKQ